MSYVRQIQSRSPARSSDRRTEWCGPWAVASLTRKDYDEAYRLCCDFLEKSSVRGMFFSQVVFCLNRLGAGTGEVTRYEGYGHCPGFSQPGHVDKRPTLASWLKDRDRRSVYLLLLTGHFVVVAGDKVIDNQMAKWTSVSNSEHRRKRVIMSVPVFGGEM